MDEPRPPDHTDEVADRLDWFNRDRAPGTYGPAVDAKRRWQRAELEEPEHLPGAPVMPGQPYWTPIGPSVNAPSGATLPAVSGRVTAIAVAPGGMRAYVGTANGGVWLTEDHGASWLPLDDEAVIPPALEVGKDANSLAVG